MTTHQLGYEQDIEGLAKALSLLAPDLANEIAKCCEQAYRRGYQQGALYGPGRDREISAWRFDGAYDSAPAAPGTGLGDCNSSTSFERLEMEAANASSLVDLLCLRPDSRALEALPE